MKTQLLRTSIFALLAVAAVYAETTPGLRPQLQGATNSTILTMTAGTVGAAAVKNPPDQQQPLQLNVPVPADREEPRVLVAPGAGGCASCIKPSPFSSWQQFRMALQVIYWI
jgi:hypothetical protein